uniref:Protein ARV n=1 Tax=Talaromyces marneffei PM1 TaxID=1077442 RepID=A0A093XS15_TALMA
MPICIECSYPVSHLYTSYSKADDRALGKGVRLTQCPRCKRFADKYVEHDNVVLFIDLVLIKPQPSIIRLGVLLLLFDVYLTWARIEKSSTLASTSLSTAPIIVQYLFFLTLNASATLAHHLVVRLGASIISKRSQQTSSSLAAGVDETPSTPTVATSFISASANVSRSPSSLDMRGLHPSASAYSTGNASTSGYGPSYWPPDPSSPPGQGLQTQLRRVSTSPAQFQPLPPPSPPSANAVSTALFVSSCPKLFPILMVIWGSKEVAVPEGGSSTADSPAVSMLHKAFATVTSSLSMPSGSELLAQSEAHISTAAGSTTASTASTSLFSIFGHPSAFLSTLTSAFNMPSLMSFLSLGTASAHLVLLNNIEALYILLDCGYLRAIALAVAGQLARWLVEKLILGLFGIY